MCCCPNQKGVKIAGLVLVILLLLGASFAIVYSGFNYNLANANLSAFSWNNISIITLSGMGYIIFTSFIGIFAFCCANICLTIIFCILIVISIIVSIILSLFGIIATTQNSFIDTIGCNTQYKDFQLLFNSIDNYIFEVDMELCSKDCPCYIANPNSYLNNTSIAKEYTKWTKADKNSGAISYAQCSDKVKNDVQNYYNSINNSSSYKLNQTDFIQFYRTIETNFNCVGLCKSSYVNRNTKSEQIMAKYLFSDLSMGPPERYGCLPHILNYFAGLLKTLGYTLLAVTVLQIVAFILACSLCYIPKNIGDEKYIAQDNFGIKRQ